MRKMWYRFHEIKRQLFVSDSLKETINKEGMDYCGSIKIEDFKKQYINDCGEDCWYNMLLNAMIKDNKIQTHHCIKYDVIVYRLVDD